MGLSAEKKKSLSALYETWGPDKVRRDLQRHYYPSLLSSEVSSYARGWLKEKETKNRRKSQFIAFIRMLSYSLFAGIVAAFLSLTFSLS